MNLTNEDVQEILQLLDATSFNELRLETDRFKLALRRDGSGDWTQVLEVLAEPNVIAQVIASPAIPGRVDVAPTEETPNAQLVEVCSSLPGTFYRAPQPGAPPFVDVGTMVDATTVVCIIETMKLMNSVRAGVRGNVAEICLTDAQFAVPGTVLMRIKPEPG
jgi:acetyl-CoA carboxylase biotin carboxyl carrier protein